MEKENQEILTTMNDIRSHAYSFTGNVTSRDWHGTNIPATVLCTGDTGGGMRVSGTGKKYILVPPVPAELTCV